MVEEFTSTGKRSPPRTHVPKSIANCLILHHTSLGTLIVDYFFCGWVSKAHLLNGRECLSILMNEMEFVFLKSYFPLLQECNGAKQLFEGKMELVAQSIKPTLTQLPLQLECLNPAQSIILIILKRPSHPTFD